MKTCNRRSSHVTMAQKSAANWRSAHAAHVDRTHSFTHLHQPQLQPRGAKRQLSYYILLEWNFHFEGRGSKLEYPDKTPDSLPANRYRSHIRGENPTS